MTPTLLLIFQLRTGIRQVRSGLHSHSKEHIVSGLSVGQSNLFFLNRWILKMLEIIHKVKSCMMTLKGIVHIPVNLPPGYNAFATGMLKQDSHVSLAEVILQKQVHLYNFVINVTVYNR